jgi:hypothetical protein
VGEREWVCLRRGERERGLSAELRSEERMFVFYAYVSERKCVIEMRKRMRMREEREREREYERKWNESKREWIDGK